MQCDNFDIIIIGAGPAGISCALELAKYNLKIAIIEKSQLPQDKICGQGIMPVGIKNLSNLGVYDLINKKFMHQVLGIKIFLNNIQVQASFTEGPGLGVSRQELSRAFLEILKKHKNIFLFEETKFISYKKNNLIIIKNNKISNLKTKFVVGADGLRSKTRKIINTKIKTNNNYKRWAIRGILKIKPWSNFVDIIFKNNIEAYVTPSGTNLVNIIFIYNKKQSVFKQDTKKLFEYFLNFFCELKNKIKLDYLISSPVITGPFNIIPREIIKNNKIALIGDAAGYLDPITGEGVNLGIMSGMCLARHIGPALERGYVSEQVLKKYLFEYKNMFWGHRLVTKYFLLSRKNKLVFRFLLKLFAKNPKILQKLLSLNMGSPIVNYSERLNLIHKRYFGNVLNNFG